MATTVYRAKHRVTVSVPGLGGAPARFSLQEGERIPAELYGRLSAEDKKAFSRLRQPDPSPAEPSAEGDAA